MKKRNIYFGYLNKRKKSKKTNKKGNEKNICVAYQLEEKKVKLK